MIGGAPAARVVDPATHGGPIATFPPMRFPMHLHRHHHRFLASSLLALAGIAHGGWSVVDSGVRPNVGVVRAMATGADGTLYAVGSATRIQGVPGRGVFSLSKDGIWRNVGGGVAGEVNDAVSDGNGNLLVAGSFESAGGVPARNLALWNGSKWSEFGGGASQAIRAMAMDPSGRILVSGIFDSIGGKPASGVMHWNVDHWESVGGKFAPANPFSLASDTSGTIFAGGPFSLAGSRRINGVARLIAGAWDSMGAGIVNTSQNSFASRLHGASDGSMWVAGQFDSVDRVRSRGVARWSNGAWTPVGGGVAGDVNTFLADGSGMLMGGNFQSTGSGVSASNIARWNGASWEPLGKGLDGSVTALGHAPDGAIIATGSFLVSGDSSVPGLARWDGKEWTNGWRGLVGSIIAMAPASQGGWWVGGDFTNTLGGSTHGPRWDPTSRATS